MAVPEYDSPENEYCVNCADGCQIYETRKPVCREFYCLWAMEPNIPDKLRPDRCGVMFEVPYGAQTYMAYPDPNRKEPWKRPEVRKLISKILATGHPVCVHVAKTKTNIVFNTKTMGINEVKQDLVNSAI